MRDTPSTSTPICLDAEAHSRPRDPDCAGPATVWRAHDDITPAEQLRNRLCILAVGLHRHGRSATFTCRISNKSYYYDNERFHKTIYVASHSGFLAEQCSALHRRLQPYRRLQLRVRNRMATSFAEHNAVVEAILSGEAEQARLLLRQHVSIQGERFSDLVATLAER